MNVKDPQPGVDATRRKVIIKAKETASPHPLTGNPITGGATLDIVLSGTTPSSQTFLLPSGAAFWSAIGDIGFKYKDADLGNGPIKSLVFKKTPGGTFSLTAIAKGSANPLNLVPPNTGTEARVSFVPGAAATATAPRSAASPAAPSIRTPTRSSRRRTRLPKGSVPRKGAVDLGPRL